jgi:surface protein
MSKETAKFAVHRDGVNYQVSGADIHDKCEEGDIFYVQRGDTVYKWPRKSVDKPWQEQDFWFHIKNLSEEVFVYPRDEPMTSMWDKDTEEKVTQLLPGREYIIDGYNDLGRSIRFEGNNGTWDFGELTDPTLLTKGHRFLADCPNFNGDVSVFSQADWKNIDEMFANCSSFNQDISGWDITHIYNAFEIKNFLLNAAAFSQNLISWCMHTGIQTPTPDYWCKGSGIYGRTDLHPQFECNDHINNPLTASYSNPSEREVGTYDNLQPGDLFFATDTDGVTYKIPYTELETIVGKEVAILHIRNITGGSVKIQGHDRITTMTGSVINSGSTDSYYSGEFLVYGDATLLKESTGNWDFGPLTSTAKRKNFADFLKGSANFNGDIQYLQVDSARDISYMFSNCTAFNQPVTHFNTSRVNTFRALFQACNVFNQPVNHFDTANAEVLMLVFQNCHKFNQPVNNWVTSECTNMNSTFFNCRVFNQDLSTWDTSKVTTLKNMFNGAYVFNQDINGWDVSNVTDFFQTFAQCKAFNQPLDNWNTENGTNFESMFYLAEVFNQPIGSWNTKNATNMNYIFYQARSFLQDLSQWCVSSVTSRAQWDYQCPIAASSIRHPKWGTCPRGEDQVS